MTVISTHMSKADSQDFKAHLGYRVRPVSKKEREMSEYMEYTTCYGIRCQNQNCQILLGSSGAHL